MKVVIFGGAGGVGSSTAFNLLLHPGDHDVVLVDCREEMVVSHVMDLEQVLEAGGSGTVRGGTMRDVLDAGVVVVAASVPFAVNTSRLAYMTDNARIIASLVDCFAEVADGWTGILLVVTNPIDPLCTWVQQRTGLSRRRVLGYTLNDSLRLRTGIARALGVEPGSVDAWVIGEHGDSCVALFDRVRVAGQSRALTPAQRSEADEFMRTWYVRHVALDSARSSTWTSGLRVARMVSAVACDTDELSVASVVLDGEYGVEGVALGVPVTLAREGARQIHEWELSGDEQAAFERSAALVREATARIEAEVDLAGVPS